MSHYFINDKNLKSNRRIINYQIRGKHFSIISDDGVFSKDELDYGTKLLIENAIDLGINGDVLDLGCGIGTVGLTLKEFFSDASYDLIDINERAIDLSKENIKKLKYDNVNAFLSNGYEKVERKYDFIITNPPIRAGKAVVYSFFEGAKEYLKENGVLLIVIRKSHGAPSAMNKLEEIFGNCTMIDRSKGFFILKSINTLEI